MRVGDDDLLPLDEMDPCCAKEIANESAKARVGRELRKTDRSMVRHDMRQAAFDDLRNGARCKCCSAPADYYLLLKLRKERGEAAEAAGANSRQPEAAAAAAAAEEEEESIEEEAGLAEVGTEEAPGQDANPTAPLLRTEGEGNGSLPAGLPSPMAPLPGQGSEFLDVGSVAEAVTESFKKALVANEDEQVYEEIPEVIEGVMDAAEHQAASEIEVGLHTSEVEAQGAAQTVAAGRPAEAAQQASGFASNAAEAPAEVSRDEGTEPVRLEQLPSETTWGGGGPLVSKEEDEEEIPVEASALLVSGVPEGADVERAAEPLALVSDDDVARVAESSNRTAHSHDGEEEEIPEEDSLREVGMQAEDDITAEGDKAGVSMASGRLGHEPELISPSHIEAAAAPLPVNRSGECREEEEEEDIL